MVSQIDYDLYCPSRYHAPNCTELTFVDSWSQGTPVANILMIWKLTVIAEPFQTKPIKRF